MPHQYENPHFLCVFDYFGQKSCVYPRGIPQSWCKSKGIEAGSKFFYFEFFVKKLSNALFPIYFAQKLMELYLFTLDAKTEKIAFSEDSQNEIMLWTA